jgi:flagellar motor switch/type III secretory pathway protein FliN
MLKDFLKRSPLAQRIKLETEIVLSRSIMDSEELEHNLQSGVMIIPLSSEKVHDLEVNGQVVARGRIIRKWGRPYFKITEIRKI